MSLKYLRSQSPGVVVTPVHWGYMDISQLAGNVRNAKDSDLLRRMFTLSNSDVVISGRTEFSSAPLPDGTYVLKFRLTDIRGNSINSTGALIEIIDGSIYVKLGNRG